MSRLVAKVGQLLQANRAAVAVGVALALLLGAALRWIVRQDRAPPPPRKVMQYTMVKVQPPPAPAPKPPPPPVAPPKEIEQPQTTRVELKATDIPPPDAPPPSASPSHGAPAAGPLALAAEGEGPGDAFNLAGNPGGRALLGGGGLGEGSGTGAGGVGGGPGTRYGWYYAKMAAEIEAAFRSDKRLAGVAARVELRIWTEPSGRITRVQLVKSTGDPRVDEAVQAVVGLRLREAPPSDIPMPMVARLTARRPI